MALPEYDVEVPMDYDENPNPSPNDVIVPHIITEDINSLQNLPDSPLRQTAEKVTFPLSEEDKKNFVKLIKRFENSEELMSLSLPQLGIGKRAFIFALNGKTEGNKNEQTFPKSVWVNPVYKGAKGATLEECFETCPSLAIGETFAAAPIFRFNRITYRVQDMMGRFLEAEAYGLAARVIQHEVDHLDGRLFVDYVDPERIMKLPEYGNKVQTNTLPELQKGIVPDQL